GGRRWCALPGIGIMQLPVFLKDVRMAPDQLVGNRAKRILDPEEAEVCGDLREQYALEDVIANLLAESRHVPALDRVDDFMRFFEHELRQRLERLLPIPRTAGWASQQRHNFDQALKLGLGHT